MIFTDSRLIETANVPYSTRYPYIPQHMNKEEAENYIKIHNATRRSKTSANWIYL